MPPHIPMEIMTEIFLNLPVKSLMRFRCLSKPFNALISSSEFKNRHLRSVRISEEEAGNESKRQVIFLGDDFHELNLVHCSLNSLILNDNPKDDDEVSVNSIELKYRKTDDLIEIVGSCDGLICVYLEDRLLLLNPATNELRKLPRLQYFATEQARINYCYTKYGFGYDESRDDYKVVAVSQFGAGFSEAGVMVYSMRSGSWRSIRSFPVKGLSGGYGNGVFSNDKVHLLWDTENTGECNAVFTFDLVTETCDSFQIPGGITRLYPRLEKFQGSLYLISRADDSFENVWVMNRYGDMNSWTKLLTIPRKGDGLAVLWMLKDDRFLLVRDGSLVLYDPRSNSSQHLLQYFMIKGATVYMESLISPFFRNSLDNNNNRGNGTEE